MIQAVLTSILALVLIVYLVRLFIRPNRRLDYFLLLAITLLLGLEVLDTLAFINPGGGSDYRRLALFLESLLPISWLGCSVLHARRNVLQGLSFLQWGVLISSPFLLLFPAFLPLARLYYAPDFPAEPVLFLRTPGYLFYLLLIGYLLAALVNLERTMKSAKTGEFWRIKFELLGIGLILTAYVLYFSQGVLFRSINMQAVPLRCGVLIVAMIMMLFSSFRQNGDIRIQVSRQFAFNSLVMLLFGAYLLLVGLIGEGMQYLGIPFGKAIVATLALLAGLALLVFLLSGQVRRQARVLLHKNFYQAKHDYRTQWLAFTSRLAAAQGRTEIQQVILQSYCDIFGIKGAMLFLYDEDRRVYNMTAMHEMPTLPDLFFRESPLVRYLDERQWVFSRQDAVAEIEAAHCRFLDSGNVSFVVPLHGEKELEGFIVLGQPINGQERYIYEDFDLMKTIARQATVSILNQRLVEQMSRLREMEAIGNISTFVIHDLKNHVAALSLLVENARQYLDNPEFQQDMLKSLDNTVTKMQGLIGRLKNLGEKELLNIQLVDLLDIARKALPLVSGAHIDLIGSSVSVQADAEEIEKVLLNFLINAVEASSDHLSISVEVGSAPQPFFRVRDEGVGMTLEFQHRELFKPFMTTKKKGLGIGLYQCRRIIEAHGGRIDVQSEIGRGAEFTVWLPAIQGR